MALSPFLGTWQKKKVIRLSPDAIVFINGDQTVPVCHQCPAEKQIKNFVTSFTVAGRIDASPSTLTMNAYEPRHVAEPLRTLESSGPFGLMSEVEIYGKGRFPDEDGNIPYYPVFWGLLTGFDRDYADGEHSIAITGKDMLRWWQLATVNLHPSFLDANFTPGVNYEVFTNIFKRDNPFEIIYKLSTFTMQNMVAQGLFNVQRVRTIKNKEVSKDALSQFIQNSREMMDYWNRRFRMVGRALKMVGVVGEPVFFFDEKTGKVLKNFRGGPSKRAENQNAFFAPVYRWRALEDRHRGFTELFTLFSSGRRRLYAVRFF